MAFADFTFLENLSCRYVAWACPQRSLSLGLCYKRDFLSQTSAPTSDGQPMLKKGKEFRPRVLQQNFKLPAS